MGLVAREREKLTKGFTPPSEMNLDTLLSVRSIVSVSSSASSLSKTNEEVYSFCSALMSLRCSDFTVWCKQMQLD